MATSGARLEPDPGDLTGVVSAQTDVAQLGRDVAKPTHERTADEDVDVANWDQVAAMADFQALLAEKVRFILPATIFFLVYYMALPILVGYFPKFMDTTVIGPINLAYLFALSQFIMTFIVAYLYLRRAQGFDRNAQAIISKLGIRKGAAK